MAFIYEDLLNGKIDRITKEYGMMSGHIDIFYWSLLLDFFPNDGKVLELGTYIGGSLLFVNEHLRSQNKNVQFTTVDHMREIGIFLNVKSPWNSAQHICGIEEYESLSKVRSTDDACNFINNRSLRLTNFPINLRWFTKLEYLDNQSYDIIFQDFGGSEAENSLILDICISKLNDNGIFIVDDYDTAHVGRVIVTMQAIREKRIFPILWGKHKVFFAKSQQYAEEYVNLIRDRHPHLMFNNKTGKLIDDMSIMRVLSSFPSAGILHETLMDYGIN